MRQRIEGADPSKDGGFALVTVLGTMTVLTIFLLSTLAYALNNMPVSRADQDGKAAIAAAQAGVDDYLSRLNASGGSYWQTTDTSNTAFTTGLAIPGTGGAQGSFTYRVLSSLQEVNSSGHLRLEVIGRSRTEQRRLIATLQPVGFLNYIYYTDVEAEDPVLYSAMWQALVNGKESYTQGNKTYYYVANPATVNTMCARYYYTGRTNVTYTSSTTDPILIYELKNNGTFSYYSSITDGTQAKLKYGCKNIEWVTGDRVDGPLHSNDALQITGSPEFTVPQTQTSWADNHVPAPLPNKRWWGGGTPSGYKPKYAQPVLLPPSNADLRTAAGSNGCVYTGATKITFSNTSMIVHSPNTTTATNPSCFTPANSANPQTITPIPPVIYVEGTTAVSCSGVGYPITGEARKGATPDHDCHLGNAYVSGTLKGNTTLGSDNDVVVTADLKYGSDVSSTPAVEGTDVLGLIANNYVWVYHPVDSSGNNLLTQAQEVHNIQAAILSLRHSFLVQSWDYGAALNAGGQKLNVTGSISQKFRGPVGTPSGTGYLKNYVYDPRLNKIPPPYFLQPNQAPWQLVKISG